MSEGLGNVGAMLVKHGKHDEGCAFFDGKPECNCGLLAVLGSVVLVTEEAEDEPGVLGQAGEAQD